jgi:hypothetical protein
MIECRVPNVFFSHPHSCCFHVVHFGYVLWSKSIQKSGAVLSWLMEFLVLVRSSPFLPENAHNMVPESPEKR